MDLTIVTLSIVVSAVVSGVVTFTLKTIIKAAIERRYTVELENLKKQHELEIEKLKAELAVKTDTEHALTERRMLAYPRIVSLVYRLRNMGRDLSTHIARTNLSLVEEFGARTKDLEEALYEFRMDLERDGLFSEVHRFKNITINFSIRAGEVKYFIERSEEERANRTSKDLSDVFAQMEEAHRRVIAELSSFVGNQAERQGVS